eukprot:912629-Amphidinium_carterae.2
MGNALRFGNSHGLNGRLFAAFAGSAGQLPSLASYMTGQLGASVDTKSSHQGHQLACSFPSRRTPLECLPYPPRLKAIRWNSVKES